MQSKKKAFFYRIDAAEFVAAVLQIPDGNHRAWVTQLALDMVSGSGTSDYSKHIIEEVESYRKNQAEAGSRGGKATTKRPLSDPCESESDPLPNSSNSNNTVAVQKQKKDLKPLSDDIPYNSILANMNEILSSRYMVTESFKRLVRARVKDGFTEEDFSIVCQKKKAEWGKDAKMSKYLRPATLFNEKMNDYIGATDGVEEFERPEHFRPLGSVKLPESYFAHYKKTAGAN